MRAAASGGGGERYGWTSTLTSCVLKSFLASRGVAGFPRASKADEVPRMSPSQVLPASLHQVLQRTTAGFATQTRVTARRGGGGAAHPHSP